jgi:BMFP domain-containing protein YqiC
MNETGGGRKRGSFFDDLAGVAGGAFSALAGARTEVEAAVRSQIDAAVQRLELVKREDLDAAMELARRAREAQEALEARVQTLEARLRSLEERLAGSVPAPVMMAEGAPIPSSSAASEPPAGTAPPPEGPLVG